MRTLNAFAVIGALLFIPRSQAHFSLTQLQPIAGFSEQCTQAYEMPLAPCTIADFYKGAKCSPQCFDFLEARTKLLNDECRGITAFPNTLIGMFFKGTAVDELCANVGVETVSTAAASQISAPSQAETTADSSATPSQVSIEVTLMTSVVQSTSTVSLAAASTSTSSASSTKASTTSLSTSTTLLDPGLLVVPPARYKLDLHPQVRMSIAEATMETAAQYSMLPPQQRADSQLDTVCGLFVL
ncbi:MAG: hypothetical protein Q9207_007294, partial [Kuettlingeria erythrocarpa]